MIGRAAAVTVVINTAEQKQQNKQSKTSATKKAVSECSDTAFYLPKLVPLSLADLALGAVVQPKPHALIRHIRFVVDRADRLELLPAVVR